MNNIGVVGMKTGVGQVEEAVTGRPWKWKERALDGDRSITVCVEGKGTECKRRGKKENNQCQQITSLKLFTNQK